MVFINMTVSKLLTSITHLLDYCWADELKHFEQEYNIELKVSEESFVDWIKLCEENGWIDHIFYHLLILRQTISESEQRPDVQKLYQFFMLLNIDEANFTVKENTDSENISYYYCNLDNDEF